MKVVYPLKTILVSILLLVGCFLYTTPAEALSVVVHVPEKYTDVEAGERFYFEIEVKYPENPSRKDLRLNYEILDKDNNLIARSKVLKAIETQASFIDYIVLPESAETGLHIINVKISDYEDLSEEVSASFHVTKAGEQLQFYFLILLGSIFFIGLLVIIQIFLVRRNRNKI